MKKLSIILMGIVFMLTMSCQQKVDIAAEKTAIQSALDNYIKSVENEDMELYGKTVTHDTVMVNFGTFGPPIVGWTALEKVITDQNQALSQTTITVSNLKIEVAKSGKFAWATSQWNFKTVMGDKPLELPVRCTWILEKQKDGWVIVHFHKSIAAG
jgi:ketosteroid isomerase-like protein